MGSRLSRHNSLDQRTLSQKRRRLDGAAEGGRGDFLLALMLKSDRLPGMLRRSSRSPYVRRVAWIKDIQKLLRDRRIEQATDVLRLLRKVITRARTRTAGNKRTRARLHLESVLKSILILGLK